MKFRNGYWRLQDGFSLLGNADYVCSEEEKSSVTLYWASKKIDNMLTDSLNTPLITTKLSSPMRNVIRVDTAHFLGGRAQKPDFEPTSEKTEVITSDHFFVTGSLSARFGKEGLRFYLGDRFLTERQTRLSGRMLTSSGKAFMAEYLSSGVEETYYGLGERFTPLAKNGQSAVMWNMDSGSSSDKGYKNIPFLVSTNGYGILVGSYSKVEFEVQSEVVNAVQFSVPGERMTYYILAGGSIKETVKLYAELCGRPALPPRWSFGLWLSTSFSTDYTEETVNHFVSEMEAHDIPFSVFHFDCFWMKGFEWVNLEWDRECFPDVKGMIERLHERGLHVTCWINPYIAQKSKLFREGMDNGYLLLKDNGDVWQTDVWQAGMAIVDFTNPDATLWYRDKLRKVLDTGVDGFKTDFGEEIPCCGVRWHDGSDPLLMHNHYTYLYNKAVFTLLEEVKGKGEALVFARSSTIGGGKFPVHWGGDSVASYASMAETLRGGLSLGFSGFGFWSHDIGGFEETSSPDLFKRWLAFGLLSSHSRLHGSTSYRVPWIYGEEASRVASFFSKLKNALLPYLWECAEEAHETGIPLLRAMVMEFEDDPAVLHLDRQYMLGPALLVAPVMREDGVCSFYLPKGRWTHLLDKSVLEGGRWFTKSYDYFSLPLYVREGYPWPLETSLTQDRMLS